MLFLLFLGLLVPTFIHTSDAQLRTIQQELTHKEMITQSDFQQIVEKLTLNEVTGVIATLLFQSKQEFCGLLHDEATAIAIEFHSRQFQAGYAKNRVKAKKKFPKATEFDIAISFGRMLIITLYEEMHARTATLIKQNGSSEQKAFFSYIPKPKIFAQSFMPDAPKVVTADNFPAITRALLKRRAEKLTLENSLEYLLLFSQAQAQHTINKAELAYLLLSGSSGQNPFPSFFSHAISLSLKNGTTVQKAVLQFLYDFYAQNNIKAQFFID